jgi:hypothetical protein
MKKNIIIGLLLITNFVTLLFIGGQSENPEEITSQTKVLGVSKQNLITPEHVLVSGDFDYVLYGDGTVTKLRK